MNRAVSVLGKTVIERILAFSWYLQGAEAREIAQALDMPVDTLNGFFKRILRDGLPALEDRRLSQSTFLPPAPAVQEQGSAQIDVQAEQIVVSVGSMQLRLNRSDPLLCRTMLFALLENGWVGPEAVANALGLSRERIRKLGAQVCREGSEALIDRRQGQTQDYAMPPEVKAELIRHYVEKIETGQAPTASTLKAAIEAEGKKCPSPQTLRVHVNKLGLTHIRADESKSLVLKKGLCTT